MARFVYSNGEVSLKASQGEEISIEMARAWAAIEIIAGLQKITFAISDLGQSIDDGVNAFQPSASHK